MSATHYGQAGRLKYLSLFSGIEAATVAWHPLGWECVAVAEIEPFPCAVLAHHYPDVPNLGSVLDITEAQIAALGPIDLVVFGSPCQDLSVAGHRKGLLDAEGNATRSGLFFTAINIVHWAREHCGCRFALWENVPGAFSSNKGRDFAAVVEWMAGLDDVGVPPKGWGTEGIALGEEALVEWATLDAQWFGVAQRRRRVFALADFGDWINRPPILLEPESLRGDSAPRRGEGEEVTPTIRAGAANGGAGHGARSGDSKDELIVPVAVTPSQDPAYPLGACPGAYRSYGEGQFNYVTHSLRGESFDAGEDGTGRGTPLVPVVAGTMKACKDSGGWSNSADHAAAGHMVPVAFHPTQDPISSTDGSTHAMGCGSKSGAASVAVAYPINTQLGLRGAETSNSPREGIGLGAEGDPMFTLQAAHSHAVAVAFEPGKMQRLGYGYTDDGSTPTLRAEPGDNQLAQASLMQVRRLTPRECERLQGFPDDYTDIPWRGKPTAPDGPRYKALGNSMAVPVMRWIGRRIGETTQAAKGRP